MNIVSEPFASNGFFSGFTVPALIKYAKILWMMFHRRTKFDASLVGGKKF
jgi:hypothetical protein